MINYFKSVCMAWHLQIMSKFVLVLKVISIVSGRQEADTNVDTRADCGNCHNEDKENEWGHMHVSASMQLGCWSFEGFRQGFEVWYQTKQPRTFGRVSTDRLPNLQRYGIAMRNQEPQDAWDSPCGWFKSSLMDYDERKCTEEK
jgi:hypothetical protein